MMITLVPYDTPMRKVFLSPLILKENKRWRCPVVQNHTASGSPSHSLVGAAPPVQETGRGSRVLSLSATFPFHFCNRQRLGCFLLPTLVMRRLLSGVGMHVPAPVRHCFLPSTQLPCQVQAPTTPQVLELLFLATERCVLGHCRQTHTRTHTGVLCIPASSSGLSVLVCHMLSGPSG